MKLRGQRPNEPEDDWQFNIDPPGGGKAASPSEDFDDRIYEARDFERRGVDLLVTPIPRA